MGVETPCLRVPDEGNDDANGNVWERQYVPQSQHQEVGEGGKSE